MTQSFHLYIGMLLDDAENNYDDKPDMNSDAHMYQLSLMASHAKQCMYALHGIVILCLARVILNQCAC